MIAIRPMTSADLERVAELTTQLGYPSTSRDIDQRLGAMEGGRHAVLVAVDESDDAIGWIHVTLNLVLEVSGQALIGGLVVDEAHRSGGIGQALVAAAEGWAREQGASTILVRSRSTRERAHRFYERLGYAETKRSHVFTRSLV